MIGRALSAGVLTMSMAACGADGAGDPAPDAGPQLGWQPLITRNWQLQPGEEKTSDLTIQDLDTDWVVGGMRPISPVGTHHTLLYRGVEGTNMVYASGVGTNELVFPAGVGLRLEAGTVLGLQLHIFNTADTMLSGTSGIEVLLVDPDSVTEEADLFLPGPQDLALPPNETTTISGSCTVTAPQKVFALFPHMHQYGTHFKTELVVGGTPQVLNDAAYSFDHQAVLSFEPIQLNAGDSINTTCTWTNPTSSTVVDGESSTTEMCYSIMYRFPRQPAEFCNN